MTDRVRTGKTAKDHQTGAWGNRFTNRESRVAWQKDARYGAFPKLSCNGKRNRSRITGKGNRIVFL